MTTGSNRIIALGAAAAFIAVLGFSTGARAETTVQTTGFAAPVSIADLGPVLANHYPKAAV